ncbi:hypothetical protein [Serratia fonticola]
MNVSNADTNTLISSTMLTPLGKLVNLLDFMSASQLADLESVAPVLDHSSALTAALVESNHIYIPPVSGWYNFGDVVIPNYSRLFGSSVCPYTVKSHNDINGKGSSIKRYKDASSIFKFNIYVVFEGLNIHGMGGAWMGKSTTGNPQRIAIRDCGIYGCTIGIGLNPGYVNEVDVYNTHLANNNVGWYNTIDSKMVGGYINANSSGGVKLMTGANDNTFIGVKNEWNGNENYFAYGATHNSISGGICDRSGSSGIAVGGGGQWSVSGQIIRRSGKDILGQRKCAHLYIEGAKSEIIFTNLHTEFGRNDDGTGDLTPNSAIASGGNIADMILIGSTSNLLGFVDKPYSFLVTPDKTILKSNLGATDFCNNGYNQSIDGTEFIANGKATILQGDSIANIPLTQPALVNNTQKSRKIELFIKSKSGKEEWFEATVIFSRYNTNTKHRISLEQCSPTGSVGSDAMNAIIFSIENIAPDASSFNIYLKSSSTESQEVTVYLK